jgi:hypothetical protein
MNERTNASKKIGDLFDAGAHRIDLICACCDAHLDGRTMVQWEEMSASEVNAFSARLELGKATAVAFVR